MRARDVCVPDDLIGQRTLIVGDVNTGKTTLTGSWGDRIWKYGNTRPCTAVLDMAPLLPSHLQHHRGAPIGGKVVFQALTPTILCQGGIHAPRLMGTSPDHIQALALANRNRIETWFTTILTQSRPDLLIINDMSIYLQAGQIEALNKVMEHAHTVLANGYLGTTLGTDTISQTEHTAMQAIQTSFDNQVWLEDLPG